MTSLNEIFEPTEATASVVYEDGSTNEDDDDAVELDEQSVPSDSMCPYCGGEPTDESARRHDLSAIGYLHDDVHLQCEDCDSEWAVGIPIGEIDDEYAADLFCDSCESRYMRVHRVAPRWRRDDESDRKVLLHLKCPNCYYFDKVVRDCGPQGISLVGYPDITGSREDADEYGWKNGST